MRLRLIASAILLGTIVGIALLLLSPTYFWYTGGITIQTQTEYDSFVSAVYKDNENILIERLVNIPKDNIAEDKWAFIPYNDNPPEMQPALPVYFRYTLKSSQPIANAAMFKKPSWIDSDKYIWSLIIAAIGLGLSGILWLLPGGLYEKAEKIPAKARRSPRLTN